MIGAAILCKSIYSPEDSEPMLHVDRAAFAGRSMEVYMEDRTFLAANHL
jgi:hypothetical protein